MSPSCGAVKRPRIRASRRRLRQPDTRRRPAVADSAVPPAPPLTVPPGPPGGPPPPPLQPPHVKVPPPPPPGSCQPDEVRRIPTGACAPTCSRGDVQIGRRCCPVATLAANAECSNSACPAGQTAIGPSNFCCDSSQVYTGAGGAPACCSGQVVNGRCLPVKTPACPPGGPLTAQCPCPTGYVPAGGACCLASQATSSRGLLPVGRSAGRPEQQRVPADPPHPDRAALLRLGPHPDGERRMLRSGQRDDRRLLLSGAGRSFQSRGMPAPIASIPACAAGYERMSDGTCCNRRFVSADRRSCLTGKPPCGPGEFRNPKARVNGSRRQSPLLRRLSFPRPLSLRRPVLPANR